MENLKLRHRVARSSLIVAIGNWTVRLISVVSLVILARLLGPSDFGLVAASAAAIVLLKALTSVGQHQYLIQKSDLEQEDLDTAWTARLLYSLIATSLILLFANKIAHFFNEPKMGPILLVLAWVPTLDALRSIGLVVKKRELDFSILTRLEIATKLISFVVTIASAFALRNYWALVIGEMVSAFALVFGSHIYAPHKVSLTLTRYKLQWRFVKWLYIQGFFNLIREKLDTVLITRYLGVVAGGQYAMAIRLGDLAVNNFTSPLTTTLYSGFSKIKDDQKALKGSTLEAANILLFITLPIFIWLTVAAESLVAVVLGDKWLIITPIIPTITAMFCMMQFIALLNTILIITGHFKVSTSASAISIVAFVIGIFTIAPNIDLELFALARMLTIGLSVAIMAFYLSAKLSITFANTVKTTWKPLCAGAFAWWSSQQILTNLPTNITDHYFANATISGISILFFYLAIFYVYRAIFVRNNQELDFIHKLALPTIKQMLKKH